MDGGGWKRRNAFFWGQIGKIGQEKECEGNSTNSHRTYIRLKLNKKRRITSVCSEMGKKLGYKGEKYYPKGEIQND